MVGFHVPVTVLELYVPPNFTFLAPFRWSVLSRMAVFELTTPLWQVRHGLPECCECSPVDGGPAWHEVQVTWVVLVKLIVARFPPVKLPWQYVDAQLAAVPLVRVYVGITFPVRATPLNATSAIPFPSRWAASARTLPDRAGWQALHATTAMVLVMWLSCVPTVTLVVATALRTSCGGFARPVVRLPWQKVQLVVQSAATLAWQLAHDGPEPPVSVAP